MARRAAVGGDAVTVRAAGVDDGGEVPARAAGPGGGDTAVCVVGVTEWADERVGEWGGSCSSTTGWPGVAEWVGDCVTD